MSSVIVLGAKGRFGRAAVAAFEEAGWAVSELARDWPDDIGRTRRVVADATDPTALTRACMGHDVIVNAINPPYPAWAAQVPLVTTAVIAAARASGATVMIPGNIYNYGCDMPPVLTEGTPWRVKTRKGGIRIRMEQAFRDSGIRTVVLRGGDFLEATKTGNWFDSHIAAKAWQGKMTYPGPRDIEHSWAFLPDMARAMVALAEKRRDFDPFETFGFGGFALDGNALIEAVEAATRQKMRVSTIPWPLMRVLGLFSPQIREVLEMRYLWNVPHRIDGGKLAAALPDFRPTPVKEAIARCVTQAPAAAENQQVHFA